MGLHHIFILLTICGVHWTDAWFFPIVQRSSNPPIVRIIDSNSIHQGEQKGMKESIMKPLDVSDGDWLSDFHLPTVDEISYAVIPPRKANLGRSEQKLHGASNSKISEANHFHFRVTR